MRGFDRHLGEVLKANPEAARAIGNSYRGNCYPGSCYRGSTAPAAKISELFAGTW